MQRLFKLGFIVLMYCTSLCITVEAHGLTPENTRKLLGKVRYSCTKPIDTEIDMEAAEKLRTDLINSASEEEAFGIVMGAPNTAIMDIKVLDMLILQFPSVSKELGRVRCGLVRSFRSLEDNSDTASETTYSEANSIGEDEEITTQRLGVAPSSDCLILCFYRNIFLRKVEA